MLKHFILLIMVMSAVASAADFSVGVSPNMIDLGNVNPGDQKLVKFSIFTVSNDPLLVNLEAEGGNMDFFNRGYRDLMPQFSEEDTGSWIQFVSNPVEINTGGDRIAGRSWEDVNFLVNIPKGAEPGYHVVSIIPTPTIYGQASAPIGATIVSVTKIAIMMNVSGNARRSGSILDSTVHSYTGVSFTIKTFFQNTGTLTLYARASSKIYDENNTFVGEFQSSREHAKPGDVTVFETPVQRFTPEGRYKVSTTVGYTTGEDTKSANINLVSAAAAAPPPQTQELPWMMIIVLIVVVAILIIIVRWLIAKRV